MIPDSKNPFRTAQHKDIRPKFAEQFAKHETCSLLIFGDARYSGQEKVLLTRMLSDDAFSLNVNRALGEMTRIMTLSHHRKGTRGGRHGHGARRGLPAVR